MLITYVKRKPVPLPSQTGDDGGTLANFYRDEVVTLPFGIPWVQQYGRLTPQTDDIAVASQLTDDGEDGVAPLTPWVVGGNTSGVLQLDTADELAFGITTISVDDSDDNVQPYVVWSVAGINNVISTTDDSHGAQLTNFYLEDYVYTPPKPWVEIYGRVYIYTDESRIVQAADALYIIELNIVPSADGVVTLRVRPINTATTVTVRQGSLGFMQEV